MERSNSNETSHELRIDEMDLVAGGMSTEAKVLVAVFFLCPAFGLGFSAQTGLRNLTE